MILITGITGFIGKNLAERLVSENIRFSCLVRPSSDKSFIGYLKKNGVKLYYGALEDKKRLDEAIKGKESVIHLAAATSARMDDMLRINLQGTKNVVESCKKGGCNRIIFISSYLAEKRFADHSAYAKSKLLSEEYIKKSGLSYVILKPSLVYGKKDSKNVQKLAEMLKSLPVMPVIGDGRYKIQPVHVSDVVDVIVSCIKDKGINNKTYYVAGDEIITFNALIRRIADELKVKRVIVHLPKCVVKVCARLASSVGLRTPLDDDGISIIDKDKFCDTSLTKKDLSFSPISLGKGLKTMDLRSLKKKRVLKR